MHNGPEQKNPNELEKSDNTLDTFLKEVLNMAQLPVEIDPPVSHEGGAQLSKLALLKRIAQLEQLLQAAEAKNRQLATIKTRLDAPQEREKLNATLHLQAAAEGEFNDFRLYLNETGLTNSFESWRIRQIDAREKSLPEWLTSVSSPTAVKTGEKQKAPEKETKETKETKKPRKSK